MFQRSQTITTTDQIEDQENTLFNSSILYNRIWPESRINLGFQLYRNIFKLPILEQRQAGLQLNLSKQFLGETLRGGLGVGYVQNNQQELLSDLVKEGNLWQIRSSWSWQISKSQQIQMSGSYVSNNGNAIVGFQESRLQISYRALIKKRNL